jgi:hypothetical protein
MEEKRPDDEAAAKGPGQKATADEKEAPAEDGPAKKGGRRRRVGAERVAVGATETIAENADEDDGRSVELIDIEAAPTLESRQKLKRDKKKKKTEKPVMVRQGSSSSIVSDASGISAVSAASTASAATKGRFSSFRKSSKTEKADKGGLSSFMDNKDVKERGEEDTHSQSSMDSASSAGSHDSRSSAGSHDSRSSVGSHSSVGSKASSVSKSSTAKAGSMRGLAGFMKGKKVKADHPKDGKPKLERTGSESSLDSHGSHESNSSAGSHGSSVTSKSSAGSSKKGSSFRRKPKAERKGSMKKKKSHRQVVEEETHDGQPVVTRKTLNFDPLEYDRPKARKLYRATRPRTPHLLFDRREMRKEYLAHLRLEVRRALSSSPKINSRLQFSHRPDLLCKPSIEVAETYFEKVVQPSYQRLPQSYGKLGQFLTKRTPMGMSDGMPYNGESRTYCVVPQQPSHSVFLSLVGHTKLKQLHDFGLGFGLYFEMLRVVGIAGGIMLAVSMYSIAYYMSVPYRGESSDNFELTILDQLSAACPLQTYYYDAGFDLIKMRAGFVSVNRSAAFEVAPEDTLTSNRCNLHVIQCVGDVLATMVLSLFLFKLWNKIDRDQAKLDLKMQTTGDYSIMVMDPNPDANDPDEWQTFFGQFGEVASVTVVLDNAKFTTALRNRRIIERELAFNVGPKEIEVLMILSDCFPKPMLRLLQHLGHAKDVLYWRDRQHYNTYRTHLLLSSDEQSFPVCRVFVTFEKEKDAVHTLNTLRVGLLPAMLDMVPSDFKKEHKFRGNNVLEIARAPEPESLIWENIKTQNKFKSFQWYCIGWIVLLLVMAGLAAVVITLKTANRVAGGFLLAFFNHQASHYVITLVKFCEHKDTETDLQQSILNKLFVFRLILSVVCIYFATPWEETITKAMTVDINVFFLANSIVPPVMGMMAPEHRKRVKQAATAPNQEVMNSLYCGQEVSLADKYSAITVTVVFALVFMFINPTGLVVVTATMAFSFFSDKFLLLRLWSRQAPVDESMAKASLVQMIIGVVMHVVITLQYVSQWSYDNICTVRDGKEVRPYECVKKLPIFPEFYNIFWPEPQDWMLENQVFGIEVYRVLVCMTIGTGILSLLYFRGFKIAQWLFFGGGDASEDINNEFICSEVAGMDFYVPCLGPVEGTPNPLLTCDTSRVRPEFICWKTVGGLFKDFDLYADSHRLLVMNAKKKANFSQEVIDDIHTRCTERFKKYFSVCHVYSKTNGTRLQREERQKSMRRSASWKQNQRRNSAKEGGELAQTLEVMKLEARHLKRRNSKDAKRYNVLIHWDPTITIPDCDLELVLDELTGISIERMGQGVLHHWNWDSVSEFAAEDFSGPDVPETFSLDVLHVGRTTFKCLTSKALVADCHRCKHVFDNLAETRLQASHAVVKESLETRRVQAQDKHLRLMTVQKDHRRDIFSKQAEIAHAEMKVINTHTHGVAGRAAQALRRRESRSVDPGSEGEWASEDGADGDDGWGENPMHEDDFAAPEPDKRTSIETAVLPAHTRFVV